MKCIVPDCARKALPDWSRCDAHVRVLIEAIFGPRKVTA